MEDATFYVYEHIRNDNNTCFYVGKGHGNRIDKTKRNEFHDNVANKYGMHTRIVQDNLTEEEAYMLEKETISNYVFNLGYGICIDGYKNYNGHYLTNMNWGGTGVMSGIPHTEEWKKQHSIDMMGEKNPMYGVNLYDTYTEEKKREIKEKLSIASSGNNNPMYGISPKERMSEDKYKEWHKKVSDRCKSQLGENNPNYKNDTLKKKLEANPELKIEYYSRKGSQNGSSKMIEMYDKDWNYINTFDYIGECAEYINLITGSNSKVNSVRTNIRERTKKNMPYKGFRFKFIN